VSTEATTGNGATFLRERPSDLHDARPWHRFAYIMRVLPRALERLSADLRVPSGGRVLDYGSATAPYRRFFANDVEFIPADLPGNPDAHVIINPDGTLPVADDSFDAILSTQVLEHVGDPALYLAECFRVLRPGGGLLLSTHGTMVWHPDPVDHWRWTCSGLREIVESAGLRVVHFEGIMGLAATGLQYVQESFYFRLPLPLAHAVAFVMQALIAFVDRFQGRESLDMNALVFALVAEKP
jgi:SAM-dependent methyltransferase